MPLMFNRKQFTFRQPDGTTIPVVVSGGQHRAVLESLDGHPLVENPATGFYEYAALSNSKDSLMPTGVRPGLGAAPPAATAPGARITRAAAKAEARESAGLPPGGSRWEQRRRAAREATRDAVLFHGIAPAPPRRQTVGDFVGLCLLIQFPDVKGSVAREEVEAFCNQPGYTGFGNNGSVYDYFFEQSLGRLRYTSVVAPYYTAKHPRSYYTNETVKQPVRARELIKEALDHLKANKFDFSRLTVDTQGYVFALNVFYAGKVTNNWAKGLWPHSYHLLAPYDLGGAKHAFDYQITDMDAELSLGTFCHENGHMICDFPDLYDYGYESAGVGAFCLMCAGANVNEKNPPAVGAYLKYKAGWAHSITQTAPGLQATAVAGSGGFFVHRKNATEYFIIENRFRSGRDTALPASGLAIWHVDELGDNQFEQMTPANHYECSLVQADGRHDLETNPHEVGDATDLFGAGVNDRFGKGTTPPSLWWDGSSSSFEVQAISPAGASMTFRCV